MSEVVQETTVEQTSDDKPEASVDKIENTPTDKNEKIIKNNQEDQITNKPEVDYLSSELFKDVREVNFDELEKLDYNQLINTICMLSPFSNEEKQKLIETDQIENKAKTLEEIISLNLFDVSDNKTIQ